MIEYDEDIEKIYEMETVRFKKRMIWIIIVVGASAFNLGLLIGALWK